MPKRRSSILGAFVLPLIALLVLLGVILAGAILSVPSRAAETFGPPAPGLSTRQRLTLSASLLWQAEDLTVPVNPSGAAVAFDVALGESVPSIVGRLWEAGLIRNPGAFTNYLQYSGLDTTLQAGEYTLSPGMSAIEIANALQDAIPGDVGFHVLAGWRVEEIAAALPTSGVEITPDDFLQTVQVLPQGFSFSEQIPADSTLEGFLYPGVYELPRETPIQELIDTLLNAFESQVSNEMRAGFHQQGLSLYQAVTLASIVQREAVVDDEKPMIASVFLNRLVIGMKLDSDPTVQYAIGYNPGQGTWWTNPLSKADLEIDSAYNTYVYPGLPPGPICNPGIASLKAVAFPAQTPYYYFRAACDNSGRHNFAETYEEHVNNACP